MVIESQLPQIAEVARKTTHGCEFLSSHLGARRQIANTGFPSFIVFDKRGSTGAEITKKNVPFI